MNGILYFDSQDISSCNRFGQALAELLACHRSPNSPLVFLCIGSDRATGDSLGPLIGYKLSGLPARDFLVYGTLAQPVHAKNLAGVVREIYDSHANPYLIAIDASLGTQAHIGYYTLGTGSLKPGAGVGKKLLCVGDAHITGIVNMAGLVDKMLLQTTRLHTVMSLADKIALGIRYGIYLSKHPVSSGQKSFLPKDSFPAPEKLLV